MDEVMVALAQVVRVGIVNSVNIPMRTARVRFPHLSDMVSGNLRVMQQYHCDLHIEPDNAHSHPEGSVPEHWHPKSYTTFWMPEVGDTVICLYLPVFNGDGVILGVLK